MLPMLNQNVPAGDTLVSGVYCTYLERLPDGNPKVFQGFCGLTAAGKPVCMKRPDDSSYQYETQVFDSAAFTEVKVGEPFITFNVDIKYKDGASDAEKTLSVSVNLNVPEKRFPHRKENADKLPGVMREKAKEPDQKAAQQ